MTSFAFMYKTQKLCLKIHIHILSYTNKHTYIHTDTYINPHTPTHTYIHSNTHTHTQHIHSYTQTHTYIHTYTHTHTHTHTHTNKRIQSQNFLHTSMLHYLIIKFSITFKHSQDFSTSFFISLEHTNIRLKIKL